MTRSLFVASLLTALSFAQGPPPSPPTQLVSNRIWITPGQPTPQQVSNVDLVLSGNPGPATNFYWVVSRYPLGNSTPAGPFTITNAPNVLSVSNFVIVNITPVSDAGVTYDVLKTSTPAMPTGACACAVATNVTSPVNDQSNSTGAYTVTTFDPNTVNLTLTNEVQGAGSAHLILRINGVFVADLSVPSSGTVTTSGSPLANQVATFASPTSIKGSPNFVFNGTLMTLGPPESGLPADIQGFFGPVQLVTGNNVNNATSNAIFGVEAYYSNVGNASLGASGISAVTEGLQTANGAVGWGGPMVNGFQSIALLDTATFNNGYVGGVFSVVILNSGTGIPQTLAEYLTWPMVNNTAVTPVHTAGYYARGIGIIGSGESAGFYSDDQVTADGFYSDQGASGFAFHAKAGSNSSLANLQANTITEAQGTITVSTPALNQSATWNSAGVAFTNIVSNITCTAAATGSIAMGLGTAGTQWQWKYGSANCGTAQMLSPTSASQTTPAYSFAGAPTVGVGLSGGQVYMNAAAGNFWKLTVNGSQTVESDSTHVYMVQPVCDDGTGNNCFTFASGKISVTGSGKPVVIPATTTVVALPAAASNIGAFITVSDSTAIAAEGQTCAGSSTNTALAVSNGTIWKCF